MGLVCIPIHSVCIGAPITPPAIMPRAACVALPGIAAEYRMEVELLEPPRAPDVYSCTRFAGFCPKNHYSGGYHHSGSIEVTVSESSGVPSCSGSPLLALSVCLVASVARRALSSLM